MRAEVIGWDALVEAGGYAPARDRGVLRLEGRDYAMQDGDVITVKFTPWTKPGVLPRGGNPPEGRLRAGPARLAAMDGGRVLVVAEGGHDPLVRALVAGTGTRLKGGCPRRRSGRRRTWSSWCAPTRRPRCSPRSSGALACPSRR